MLRRTIGITAAAAAVSIAAIAPANAEAPPLKSYEAAASGTALELTLLGEDLAVSQTQAVVSNTPSVAAAADGAALLLAGTPVPEGALVKAPEGPAAKEVCAVEVDLATLTSGAVSLADAALACATTNAAITAGAPAADSGTSEFIIRITGPGGTLIEPLLSPVLEGATEITDPLIEALAPLLGVITEVTEIDVATVINDIITAVGDDTFVLAEISVGATMSQARANAVDGVVAEAGSDGVTINILPGIASTLAQLVGLVDLPDPSTGPLLSVELGAANASVVRNPTTGAPAPDASAAQLLSIAADDDLGIIQGITGQLTDAVSSLAVTQLSCDGGVLADIICIDLGAVNELDSTELAARNLDFGEGTVGREASAASVQVLPIAADALGGNVLGVSLARATAAANAVPADAPGPLPGSPRADGPPILAETGGTAALPLTLALLAVGAAGAILVRRSRTV
jgi:hypothetical protein